MALDTIYSKDMIQPEGFYVPDSTVHIKVCRCPLNTTVVSLSSERAWTHIAPSSFTTTRERTITKSTARAFRAPCRITSSWPVYQPVT